MQQKELARLFVIQRLYRQVLKLHRQLPKDLRQLGDEYVKDEFRRHKGANQLQAYEFMTEWKTYCETLQRQLYSQKEVFGENLNRAKVELLSQEQIGQLFELQLETTKKDSENN